MTKVDMEKAIIEKIKELTKENDEIDRETREFPQYENPFYYNGYIFKYELIDLLSLIVFNHSSQVETDVKDSLGVKKLQGSHRYQYESNLTDDEVKKINTIIENMVKSKIIKFSKSGKMFKLV